MPWVICANDYPSHVLKYAFDERDVRQHCVELQEHDPINIKHKADWNHRIPGYTPPPIVYYRGHFVPERNIDNEAEGKES
jgi:hypothetical protein